MKSTVLSPQSRTGHSATLGRLWTVDSGLGTYSRAKTFAAGATGGGVRVLHFEAALQRIEIIQFTAGDVERALGIHHHTDTAGFDEEIAVGRAVLQIHFILQTGATAADNRDAEHAIGAILL